MREKLVQAAIITLLLNLIAGVSSPSPMQTSAATPKGEIPEVIVSFLNRALSNEREY
jgi:hypothetical protein